MFEPSQLVSLTTTLAPVGLEPGAVGQIDEMIAEGACAVAFNVPLPNGETRRTTLILPTEILRPINNLTIPQTDATKAA